GLGDPNAPSWGSLLNQGRENIDYTWLIYAPGMAVFLLVTCLNLLGNGLREALDPKSTS
ncbi:MAG: ABC transporter permease, partial [Planctomycetes bacterium]|nr:ABC transporter permease [Planctomycetota bacterium]